MSQTVDEERGEPPGRRPDHRLSQREGEEGHGPSERVDDGCCADDHDSTDESPRRRPAPSGQRCRLGRRPIPCAAATHEARIRPATEQHRARAVSQGGLGGQIW